ncbi:hypothetical protein GCM10011491_30910 [Brucella endophytica]|uniref:Uncharacterized protein n=1 Tax=Brucella endophytica TaxID=1963359 RepID=A0A916WIA2_9HYPH|nr:hypothetical protein GCM10011491_30910 [Brucella endophytica]
MTGLIHIGKFDAMAFEQLPELSCRHERLVEWCSWREFFAADFQGTAEHYEVAVSLE